MKSKLSYIVLFSVFGIVGAAAAETAGMATSTLAYTLPFSAFIISLVLLTLSHDYGRSIRSLSVAAANPVLTPANEAFDSADMISRRPAIRRSTHVRRARSVVAHG